MLATKQLTVVIDFHSIFFPYYGSQWLPSTKHLVHILVHFNSFGTFKEDCMKTPLSSLSTAV